jgi:choline dehydrogenase-like flavoprotein
VPEKRVSSRGLLADPDLDARMTADLHFHDPASDRRFGARLATALRAYRWSAKTVVHGDRGRIEIVNPYAPQLRNSITVRSPAGRRRGRLPRQKSSYDHQLEAFLRAVAEGDPMLAQLDNSVRNMEVIDALYERAGFPLVVPVDLATKLAGKFGHQCGTCRFGSDPASSVLDSLCRAHDVENLYVVDGSFLPSSSAINPTLTIVAQALRVGEHLVETIAPPA